MNEESIKLYLKEIGDIPVLSDEELKKLIPLAQKGNIYAKQKLIESNLKLVIAVARKYFCRQQIFDLLDLVGEGTLGLIKAIEKYNVKYGYKFSTYAYWWIKQTIQQALSAHLKMIYIPPYTKSALRKLHKFVDEFRIQKGRDPSTEEAAKALKTSAEKVEALFEKMKMENEVASLDKPIDDEEEILLADLMISPGETSQDAFQKELKKRHIEKAMASLTKRERAIIRARYGFTTGKVESLAKLSKKFSLTRERIRQIEKKALLKMKDALMKEGITEDF